MSLVLPRYRSPELHNVSRGFGVIEWAHEHLETQKGPLAGNSLTLTRWEQWVIQELFEEEESTDLRYRRGLIGVGRQNGKSVLGSTLGLEALFRGPQGSEIYSAAGDKKQARIVFNAARRQVSNSEFLSSTAKVYRDAIEIPETGNVYRVLSADAALQQGLSPFLVIFDEVHVQRNEELWDALSLGMGARPDALILGITTAGYDPETLCGRMYDYGKKVASGEIDDPSFFFAWWEPTEADCDKFSHEAWRQANPSYAEGLLLEKDLQTSAMQQQDAAFRRYRLNQWVPMSGESWMDYDAWNAAGYEFEGPKPGASIVLGFDGSVDRDATALIGIDLDSMTIYPVKIWEPTGVQGWQVPRDEVDAIVSTQFDQFDVRALGADPAWWRRELQEWTDRYPGRVYEWPVTNQRMAPAVNSTYAAVLDGTLRHDENQTLTRHVFNAVMKDLGGLGITLKKENRGSARWIDACVAMCIAVDMAERYAEPEQVGELLFF